MPVAAVTSSPATVPSGRFQPATSAQPPADEGFQQVLDEQLRRPADAPTVTLGTMVASLAGDPVPASALSDGTGGVATAAVGDAWGVAADRPTAAMSGPGAQVLSAGERYLGVPYKWGGTDPNTGFDCSGFVQRAFADVGVDLPRVSIDQSRQGREVPGGLDAAQPGDLLFWSGNGGRPNHIGIYAGEGRMLVAPSSGDVVRYQEVTRTPDAVRRVL